jgi:hypothetical protein
VQGYSGDPMPWTVDWWRWRSARRVKFADEVQAGMSHVHVLRVSVSK